MSDVWLIRHGQAGDVMGDYDRLSELGFEQSRLAGHRWQHLGPIQAVVSGDMRRHRETEETFRAAFGDLPPRSIDPGWNEFDHQVVVRKALAAGMAPDPAGGRAAFFRFFLDAMGRWGGGQHDEDYPETYTAFTDRVVGGLHSVLDRLDRKESALVFTSGGAISAVCRHVLDLTPDKAFQINLALVNTGVTRIQRRGGLLHLGMLNAHPHLDGHPDALTHS